jgi:hypothetical protein
VKRRRKKIVKGRRKFENIFAILDIFDKLLFEIVNCDLSRHVLDEKFLTNLG